MSQVARRMLPELPESPELPEFETPAAQPLTPHAGSEADDGDDTLEDIFASLDEDEADGEPADEPEQEAVGESRENAKAAGRPPAGNLSADELLPDAAARASYALSFAATLDLAPRPYQRDAVAAWLRADGRGIVVLPTGAGKTVVAYDAIARLGVRTLIVVPTIELLRQWRAGVVARLGVPAEMVGVVGGGEHTTGPITVITYDSAAMPRRNLDGYGLLVFDEVHHLPAQSYRAIAAKSDAPWRMGLSATLARADERHLDLAQLIGPVVYERAAEELSAQKHIAAYTERRVFVDLTQDEELRYESLMGEWRFFLSTRRSQLGTGPGMFAALIQRSGFDPEARRALRAHHEARLVAMNASAKIAAIEQLLRTHAGDKVIVFSEYVEMVDRISRALMLPAITYRTPAAERRAILEGFRSGQFSKLVTGRVLNEGVDVPDANVAIVASGSASMREYVQRLGRVLRPKPSEAMLYELISRRTTERNASRRRRPKKSVTQQAGA